MFSSPLRPGLVASKLAARRIILCPRLRVNLGKRKTKCKEVKGAMEGVSKLLSSVALLLLPLRVHRQSRYTWGCTLLLFPFLFVSLSLSLSLSLTLSLSHSLALFL